MQTLSLEIKGSHMDLGQASVVDVPIQRSQAVPKTTREIAHCVPGHCIGEESMRCSSTVHVFFSSING